MFNTEDYKRKKWIALVKLVFVTVIFVGLLLWTVSKVEADSGLVAVCVAVIPIWVSVFVQYKILSTKTDILKELQNKNDLGKKGSE